MIATNPINGCQEKIVGSFSRIWVLILGPIYYAVRGAWVWAVASYSLLRFGSFYRSSIPPLFAINTNTKDGQL